MPFNSETYTVSDQFIQALKGKHADIIREALGLIRKRFADDKTTEGYLKDGPVSAAKFELGEDSGPEARDARIRRQRDINYLIEELLKRLGY